MRSPIYRNLDQPFQIFGFSAIELVILCLLLVAGGELTALLGIHRIWSIALAVIIAICFYWTRRLLGNLFIRRLVRFLQLPGRLYPRLLNEKGTSQ